MGVDESTLIGMSHLMGREMFSKALSWLVNESEAHLVGWAFHSLLILVV